MLVYTVCIGLLFTEDTGNSCIFLQAGVPDPPDMKISLVEKKLKERDFLQQLMDGSKLENYKIDVPVKAELRKYQQVHDLLLSVFTLYQNYKYLDRSKFGRICRRENKCA